MVTKSKDQEAWAIAVELHKLGVKAVQEGNWMVLRPPPPVPLLMRIMALPDGLVESLLPKVAGHDS